MKACKRWKGVRFERMINCSSIAKYLSDCNGKDDPFHFNLFISMQCWTVVDWGVNWIRHVFSLRLYKKQIYCFQRWLNLLFHGLIYRGKTIYFVYWQEIVANQYDLFQNCIIIITQWIILSNRYWSCTFEVGKRKANKLKMLFCLCLWGRIILLCVYSPSHKHKCREFIVANLYHHK